MQKSSFFAGLEDWSKHFEDDPSSPRAIFDLILTMYRSGEDMSSFEEILKAKDCLALDYKAV